MMGSFNVACSVSRISLSPGMPVAFFPLEKSEFPTFEIGDGKFHLIYPDAIMSPITLPIFGEYDDYGYVDCVEKDANVEIIERFSGIPIKDICRHKALLPNQISCMFVHREVYDHMAKNHTRDWDGSPNHPYYNTKSRDDVREKCRKGGEIVKYNRLNMEWADAFASGDEDKAEKISEKLAKIIETNGIDILAQYHGLFGAMAKTRAEIYNPQLEDANENIIEPLVDFLYFESNMSAVNAFYFPAHNGCQDGHYFAVRDLTKLTTRICEERIETEKE